MLLQVTNVFDPTTTGTAMVPGAGMGPAAAAVAALAACTERLRDALRCNPDLMDTAVDAANRISPPSQQPTACKASVATSQASMHHGTCIIPCGRGFAVMSVAVPFVICDFLSPAACQLICVLFIGRFPCMLIGSHMNNHPFKCC